MPRPRQITEKRCPRCQEVKPLSEFYAGASYEKSGGGTSPYCKPCMRERNREWKAQNPEHVAEIQKAAHRRRYEADPESHKARSRANAEAAKLRDPAAWRAKRFFDGHRNVAADLTREFIAELFRRTVYCQCCGKKLVVAYEPSEQRSTRSNPDAPSIDRVNNLKGYTRQNIAVICWECNFRKTDLTLADLEMFRAYIELYGDLD